MDIPVVTLQELEKNVNLIFEHQKNTMLKIIMKAGLDTELLLTNHLARAFQLIDQGENK